MRRNNTASLKRSIDIYPHAGSVNHEFYKGTPKSVGSTPFEPKAA
jgi:hypothetical protein